MEEYDVIELDDDGDGNLLLIPIDDEPRNARGRGRGRSRGGRSRGGRSRGRGGSRGSRGRLGDGGRRDPRAPIQRPDTGQISTGELVNAAAQVLAAMTSLPGAPTATGDAAKDVANLIEYQSLLAQHAKRDEQFRTVGSLAAKFFA